RRLANHPPQLPLRDPSAALVRHEVGVGTSGKAEPAQHVDVFHDRLHQLGRHLDLANARLRLGVGDVEASAVRVVDAHLTDAQLLKLADANAAASQDLAHHATAEVRPQAKSELRQVVADR